jgi:hypothetical protein
MSKKTSDFDERGVGVRSTIWMFRNEMKSRNRLRGR